LLAPTTPTHHRQNYLLTAAMDGNIRCWSPGSASILNAEPEFTFSGSEEDAGGSGAAGGPRPNTYVRGRVRGGCFGGDGWGSGREEGDGFGVGMCCCG